MSTPCSPAGAVAPPPQKVNLRTPDVMSAVQEQVESHYRSDIVDKIRRNGGMLSVGDVTVRLAKQFGFCYGVERAIDLAYAAGKVFKDRRLFILGEIIHNPEVNEQIRSLGIKNLMGKSKEADIADLQPGDVVIVPAFGTEVATLEQIKERGCQIVDTTCGDVMSVWKRVRKYASESATSIIHGKAEHEETKATSSRALGNGQGHYLVVLTLAETDYVCDYIRHGGNKQEFLEKFRGAYSPGFDPDLHLRSVGVANQTTMMRGETEEVQRRIRQAIIDRDGPELGATEFPLLRHDLRRDAGAAGCAARVARREDGSAARRRRLQQLEHLAPRRDGRGKAADLFRPQRLAPALERARSCTTTCTRKQESVARDWLPAGPLVVGITAGASCPNNLIEETLIRLFELRGISREQLEARVILYGADRRTPATSSARITPLRDGELTCVMRAIWKGSISFGLVNIPIALYPATRKEELKFRLLRATDHSPVNYKRVAAEGRQGGAVGSDREGLRVREREVRRAERKGFSARRSRGDADGRYPGLRRHRRDRSDVFLQAVLPRAAERRRQSLRACCARRWRTARRSASRRS